MITAIPGVDYNAVNEYNKTQGSNIPGGQYEKPGGQGWLPGGPEQWARDHRVDPNTGELIGPSGLVPSTYGRRVQAEHDRAVWRRRQQLMQDGVNYQKGALNLLQSYRPGGGAALESGVYTQLGQMQFQRAQMTQPMDFLSDLRRHEGAQAASRANRASERQVAVQLGAAVAQVATAYFAPAAAPYINPALAALSAGYSASQGANRYQQQPAYSGNLSAPQGGQAPSQQVNSELLPTNAPGSSGGQSPFTPGQQQPSSNPVQGSAARLTDEQAGPNTPSPLGDGQGLAASGGTGNGGMSPGQGDQQGPGANAGMVGIPAGSNGDFSHTAFAASSAASWSGNPQAQVLSMEMNNFTADVYENDPFFQTLPLALELRWRSRMQSV